MPEVFDHFFRLLGTQRGRAARPGAARPRLPGLLRGRRRAGRRRAPTAETTSRLFERIEPGSAMRLRDATSTRPRRPTSWPCSASSTRPSPDLRGSAAPDVLRRAPRLAAPARSSRSRRSSPHGSRDPRLRQILGYPAVFLGTSPVRGAEHVPPDEPPRPRATACSTRGAASPR